MTEQGPPKVDVLLALLRELDAEWPAELDAAAIPDGGRLELMQTIGRLQDRLDAFEAELMCEIVRAAGLERALRAQTPEVRRVLWDLWLAASTGADGPAACAALLRAARRPPEE